MFTTLIIVAVALTVAGGLIVRASPAREIPPVRTGWQRMTVSALCEAEELLDALENSGVAERELIVLGCSCFAIRWR